MPYAKEMQITTIDLARTTRAQLILPSRLRPLSMTVVKGRGDREKEATFKGKRRRNEIPIEGEGECGCHIARNQDIHMINLRYTKTQQANHLSTHIYIIKKASWIVFYLYYSVATHGHSASIMKIPV